MKPNSPLLKKLNFSGTLPAAFLIPFLGTLIVLLVNQCEPFFDQYALLYSDEYHQYYPFFLEYRRALLRGDSLLYSWNVGMGMDYLGLISYYLASPLNLLSVFVPESLVLEYFSILPAIKLGLAGLFFAIMLKKAFGKNDISIALFGSFYALCAWALGYQWNIMWLDTFALLPLVALGTVALLRDGKYLLYTVTLTLSIVSNYYIGLFTCIFVLLLFICYQICRCTGFRDLLRGFGRIALFSVLAICMTAILELPALSALQNTYSAKNEFPTDFSLNIVDNYDAAYNAWEAFKAARSADAGVLTLMGKWFVALIKSFPPLLEGMALVAGNMSGELAPTMMEGLPNIACGVGPMVMAFLFLTAREVKLRDKLCCVFLLVLFMLSFVIRQLDYIWHGLHFTNMIPYRFSFLYSFVLLYMAYRTWLLRDSFGPWQLAIAFALSGVMVIFSEKANDWIFLAYNVAILLLYATMFLLTVAGPVVARLLNPYPTDEEIVKQQRLIRRIKAISLCCLMLLELGLILVKYGLAFRSTPVNNYPDGQEYAASIFNYVKEREKNADFYRIETTHAQILNDGALNDYHGISTFTSSANVRVTTFLEAMGLAAYPPYNRYCYEETSPVTNLFLNLKYTVERDNLPDENPYFEQIHTFGGVYLLQNSYYLPLGFLAESSLSEATMDLLLTDEKGEKEENEFFKQNIFFSLATGLEEDVWTMYSGQKADITAYDVTLDKKIKNSETAFIKYHSDDREGKIHYSYTMDTAGYLCMELNMSEENEYILYLNGQELSREDISVPQIISVAQVKPGDEVVVEIICPEGVYEENPGAIGIRTALLNDDVFRQGYEILSASTLDLTAFSNTLVEGTIQCNRDGLLYTSIPFDGNWVAEVDGREAEIVLVGDAMMALELTEGSHTITFRYQNKAFTIGAIVSAASLIVFLSILFIPKLRRKPTPEAECSPDEPINDHE